MLFWRNKPALEKVDVPLRGNPTETLDSIQPRFLVLSLWDFDSKRLVWILFYWFEVFILPVIERFWVNFRAKKQISLETTKVPLNEPISVQKQRLTISLVAFRGFRLKSLGTTISLNNTTNRLSFLSLQSNHSTAFCACSQQIELKTSVDLHTQIILKNRNGIVKRWTRLRLRRSHLGRWRSRHHRK
jgi:hypothetical protein